MGWYPAILSKDARVVGRRRVAVARENIMILCWFYER
jgi:hypothetical protein